MKKIWSYLNNMFIPLHIKQIMAHSIIGPFMYDRSNLQLHMSDSVEIYNKNYQYEKYLYLMRVKKT